MRVACALRTVGDGVVELAERRVVSRIDAAMLIGSKKLFDYARENERVRLQLEYTHDAEVLARQPRFVAINSAVEVDFTGQVNGELAGASYVGAVGGALDFVRAANRSPGGVASRSCPRRASWKSSRPRIRPAQRSGRHRDRKRAPRTCAAAACASAGSACARAESPERADRPERCRSDRDKNEREDEPAAVAAGQVVQYPANVGAEGGAERIHRIDRSVDRRHVGAGKDFRADRRHDRSARTHAQAEDRHEGDEQGVRRELREDEKDRHAACGAGGSSPSRPGGSRSGRTESRSP